MKRFSLSLLENMLFLFILHKIFIRDISSCTYDARRRRCWWGEYEKRKKIPLRQIKKKASNERGELIQIVSLSRRFSKKYWGCWLLHTNRRKTILVLFILPSQSLLPLHYKQKSRQTVRRNHLLIFSFHFGRWLRVHSCADSVLLVVVDVNIALLDGKLFFRVINKILIVCLPCFRSGVLAFFSRGGRGMRGQGECSFAQFFCLFASAHA